MLVFVGSYTWCETLCCANRAGHAEATLAPSLLQTAKTRAVLYDLQPECGGLQGEATIFCMARACVMFLPLTSSPGNLRLAGCTVQQQAGRSSRRRIPNMADLAGNMTTTPSAADCVTQRLLWIGWSRRFLRRLS